MRKLSVSMYVGKTVETGQGQGQYNIYLIYFVIFSTVQIDFSLFI